MATNDNTKTAAYENYPNNPLTFANLSQSVLGTVTVVRTVESGFADKLILDVVMTTDAAADLAVAVWPIGPDGVAINAPLTAAPVSGPTLNAGKVYFTGEYDVTTQERVQVRITNNDPVARDIVATAKVI